MNAYEVEYMRKYNTLVPNGYNLREGGNSGKHHEDTKKANCSVFGLVQCAMKYTTCCQIVWPLIKNLMS